MVIPKEGRRSWCCFGTTIGGSEGVLGVIIKELVVFWKEWMRSGCCLSTISAFLKKG